MSVLWDVVATVGKYQPKNGGKTKYISRNVGSVIETRNGPRLKLSASFSPAGCERDEDGSVWLALFPPKPKGQQQEAPPDFQDSDIPDFV